MLKELVITSAEQAKVLANPLRLQILALFEGKTPHTSKQLADLLELPPAKVHYHVRELLNAGILELVETKEKGGVIEKYYLPVAERFKVDLNESETGVTGATSTRQLFLKTVLDDFQQSIAMALENAEQKKADQKDNKKSPTIHYSYLSLSEEEAQQLSNELDELLQRWSEKEKSGTQENKKRYGLFLSFYEKPDSVRTKGTMIFE